RFARERLVEHTGRRRHPEVDGRDPAARARGAREAVAEGRRLGRRRYPRRCLAARRAARLDDAILTVRAGACGRLAREAGDADDAVAVEARARPEVRDAVETTRAADARERAAVRPAHELPRVV